MGGAAWSTRRNIWAVLQAPEKHPRPELQREMQRERLERSRDEPALQGTRQDGGRGGAGSLQPTFNGKRPSLIAFMEAPCRKCRIQAYS